MRKYMIIILVFANLLCVAGCENAKNPPTKAELAVLYGIDESVIDDHHKRYPKVMNLPSEDIDFAVDRVIIGVYQFAYQHDFKPEEFPEIPCKSVQPLVGPFEGSESPSRYLILNLKTKSKEQVIKAIELLQQRADIYIVEPDYICYELSC